MLTTKALIYCRVSTERQVEDGHGLGSQEKRCRDYAIGKGYKVIKVFWDEGISGSLFERPAMKEMIAFLDNASTENFIIIFDDLARFARDVAVHIKLKTELEGRGAKLECPNFNFDDSPEGEFAEMIIASSNQLYRKQNRRQVIQKMKSRLEKGYWPFCMPPGLKNFIDPTRGRILQPDNGPQATVRKAVIEKFAYGELRTQDEVKLYLDSELQKAGVRSNISHHGVQSLLKNPLYYGLIEYKPWEIPLSKGKHDGLVSPDLYPNVLSRFTCKPKFKLRKDYSDDFPFRGLIRCSKCGGSFTGSWNTGRNKKKYPHYDCKQLGCPMRWKSVHRDKLHGEFIKLIGGVTPSENIIDLAGQVMLDIWEQHKSSYETCKTQRLNQLNEVEQDIETLKIKLLKAHASELEEFYEKELEKMLVNKKGLETQEAGRSYSEEEFGTALNTVLKTIKNPVDMWQSPDWHDKRTIALMYFDDRLTYDRESGFGNTKIAGTISLIQELGSQKVPDVEMEGSTPRVEI